MRDSVTSYLKSYSIRYILLEHLDNRPVAFSQEPMRLRSLDAMIGRGWLRYDNVISPKLTYLTTQGRAALAAVLAAWADELVGVDSLPPKSWTAPVISDDLPGDVPRPL